MIVIRRIATKEQKRVLLRWWGRKMRGGQGIEYAAMHPEGIIKQKQGYSLDQLKTEWGVRGM